MLKLPVSLASRLSAALLPPCRRTLTYPTFSRSLSTRSLLNLKRRRFDKEISRPAAPPLKPAIPDVVVTHLGPSNDWYPHYDRLMPCPSENTIPRVEHLVSLNGGNVVDFICKSLHLPHLYVVDLIHFGAVFYALVCPNPPPTATPQQFRLFKEVTDPAVLKKRSSIRGKTLREAQKTFRVTDPDQILEAGTYLRVHVHPKRFPRCYEVDWKSRVIETTDSYVVLDKPAGISVGGTTDNIEECCATFASRALGFEDPLITTHQIDNCSEGCVVFSRTKEFCSFFHRLMREQQVKKLYLALASAPVPTGVISHYMRPAVLAPKLVSEENEEGWHLSQLEVLECIEVPWPSANISEAHGIEDSGWPPQEYAYECKVNLLTGKTHQIRAQFAAIGAPLVGDAMYMPAAAAEMANPDINPFGRCRRQHGGSLANDETIEAWIAAHGKEPKLGIGLKASHISWGDGCDGKFSYEAGAPWWRQ
ncbi:Pseudouridine synthase family protein [Rhynchospora pubera]|uniref:Pseudouridine synthase family protein n=1 Tax=Rhynchospora pubera TaxID=906938 RepID=A0AAV8EA68_9POAL|nr:Pseudouridine synthase family protein [Rhynchospora pubera]